MLFKLPRRSIDFVLDISGLLCLSASEVLILAIVLLRTVGSSRHVSPTPFELSNSVSEDKGWSPLSNPLIRALVGVTVSGGSGNASVRLIVLSGNSVVYLYLLEFAGESLLACSATTCPSEHIRGVLSFNFIFLDDAEDTVLLLVIPGMMGRGTIVASFIATQLDRGFLVLRKKK